MLHCYHTDVVFEDPAFGELKGEKAHNMWRMLLSNPEANTKIKITHIQQTENQVVCHWTADYIFGKKKRPIHNVVESTFTFDGNKIIEHRDTFNLHKWLSQAFGFIGTMLGWSSYMQNKVRKQSNYYLNTYVASCD